MDAGRLLVSTLATAPALVFASTILLEAPAFFDPCFEWDGDGRAAPTQECPRVSESSESRSEAALRLAVFQGSSLLFAALGAYGLYTRWPQLAFLAAAVLFLISVPLMLGAAFAPVLVSAVLLASLAASKWGRDDKKRKPRSRAEADSKSGPSQS